VQDNEKNDHRDCLNLLGPERCEPLGKMFWIGADEGTRAPMPCGASTST
jgi:hypothetical protein